MTAKEQLLVAALKPLLPQIKQQLTPALQTFVEAHFKDIDAHKTIADTQPILLICRDTQDHIYLCDALMRGVEIVGIMRKIPLDGFTNRIITHLTDL